MFICAASFAQRSVNNYKYVVVPEKFDFVNQTDKYQTSSLTQFLLKKQGFEAFLDSDKMPLDIKRNRCLTLEADVINLSSMFTTKMVLELKDCNNNIVFTSSAGTSRSKDYKRAYQEAIRNAFKSLQYKYQPLEVINENPRRAETVPEVVAQNRNTAPRVTVFRRGEFDVDQREGRRGAGNRRGNTNRIPSLYAKPVKQGFVLLNVKKEPVFALLQTALDKVFVIKNKNGLLYKDVNNGWIAEFYDVYGAKVIKKYDIRLIR